MKKAISLLLAMVLCLSLCACGGNTKEVNQGSINNQEANNAASEKAENAVPEVIDGMRPEFKEAMDSYEAFYDEYCQFMTEYSKNPTDPTLALKYSELLVKVAEMDKEFQEWNQDEMNDAELTYYLEVSNRVMQKLIDVAG